MKRYKRLYVVLAVLLAACIATFALSRYKAQKEQIQTSGETILSISADEVESLSWDYDGQTLSFHRDGAWSYDDDAAFPVDAEQMNAIKENIYNYFGVNADILQNKAYGDAWSAFYEGAIEPFAVQFSDVSTKMLFSERERASGSFLMATANRLQYMSNTEKLNVSAQMADRGIMNRDEIREIWNLPPLPDGQGQAYTIRGEYYLLGADGNVMKKGDDLTDDQ